MSRIFLGNFNFEHELAAAGDRFAKPHSRATRAAELAGSDREWVWLAIAESDDIVITDGDIAPAEFSHEFSQLAELGLPLPRFMEFASKTNPLFKARLVPWGWTDGIWALGKEHGWECVAPPPDIVRRVNTRAFRFEIEHEWEICLADSAAASSLDELEAILQRSGNTSRGWLLKGNFGMSGREARRGRGAVLDDNTRNWSRRRLQSSGPIIFEPVVERIAEAGIQMEIPQTGEPALVGVTPLLVDGGGVYRGSRFACPDSELVTWQPAVETGLRVAKRLQGLGYFGPLGIDAMQYRDNTGNIRLRPLQDLNARYTMGRLALGFRRILPAGWCGSWLHFGAKNLAGHAFESWISSLGQVLPQGSRAVPASARQIGSRSPLHHAVVVLAPTTEILNESELTILGSLGITVFGTGM